MTYEDFKWEMIREFCPESIRVARDIAFMTTGYDPTIPVPEIVRQFQRELLLSGHLVPLEETKIHLLAMRLPTQIVVQLATQSHLDLQTYQRAVLLYDEAQGRAKAIVSCTREGKRLRTS